MNRKTDRDWQMSCRLHGVASCTQQKKIEELEAQLQEADDIVKDLREELRAVEAELERFPRSKQVKHHVQVDNASIPEPPVTCWVILT
uniref:Uncharacterized protein n=1 Tax=Lactuca sativa TaxID=4236 RepID=A0A9R1VVI5_LACSA|nr:hypothetical protein LSAT_V11C400175650 [Lactuca sativa]